eukprot:1145299-Pelagomonas_calceolata.AAC.3
MCANAWDCALALSHAFVVRGVFFLLALQCSLGPLSSALKARLFSTLLLVRPPGPVRKNTEHLQVPAVYLPLFLTTHLLDVVSTVILRQVVGVLPRSTNALFNAQAARSGVTQSSYRLAPALLRARSKERQQEVCESQAAPNSHTPHSYQGSRVPASASEMPDSRGPQSESQRPQSSQPSQVPPSQAPNSGGLGLAAVKREGGANKRRRTDGQ